MRKQFFRRLPLPARWLAAILLLSLFALSAFAFFRLRSARNSSPLGTENDSLLQSHREDFSPDIEQNIAVQLDDPSKTIKAYLMLSGTWFLSEKLSDFSQALTTEAIYAIPGDKQGGNPGHAYSLYAADENGVLEWKASSSGSHPSGSSEDQAVPCGFYGLTDEIIENVLSEAGIEYEDYVAAWSQTIDAVFVWIRKDDGDLFLTYPTRPDLTGLEAGGIYTLPELQRTLSEAYEA